MLKHYVLGSALPKSGEQRRSFTDSGTEPENALQGTELLILSQKIMNGADFTVAYQRLVTPSSVNVNSPMSQLLAGQRVAATCGMWAISVPVVRQTRAFHRRNRSAAP